LHPVALLPHTAAGMARRRKIARSQAALLELIAQAQQARTIGPAMNPWQLPIVVACRRIIADTAMQLPVFAMRGGQRRPDQPAVFRRPNPNEPYWLTIQRIVSNLTGAGYCWILPTAYDAAGYPLAFRVCDASKGAPTFDLNGEMVDVWIDGRYQTPGKDGVIWLPYEVPANGHVGQGPFAACWQAVTYLSALYEMAGSFWEAGFPSVAIEVATRLGPDDAPEMKRQILSSWSRRHEPAIIDNGGKIVPIGSSAVEAQLIESINWANAEIARTAGVMPSLVNVAGGDSLTYSTTAGEFTKWRIVGLGPYLTRMEGAFSDLQPFGTDARFDTTDLTRADEAAQADYFTNALGRWMTADEIRQRIPFLAGQPTPAELTINRMEEVTA